MLKKILSISGKPGLFRLISRGNRNLIVEILDSTHKRLPAFATERIISLADIAMYTDSEEIPLRRVMKNILEQEGGQPIALSPKTASREQLAAFMSRALPNYDRDRVHPSDIKKLIQWYNILVANQLTNFDEDLQETQGDNIVEEETKQ
ncbi:MAG: DUF5606 domain-containing protein [Prevotellaceae bacterium]|nr:DUF5606 domain-containing protein [Prevotellaceae bacterium]